MGETASLWVDHLLPATPYRQWVLSFDGPMAVRLGYDTELLSLVCRSFSSLVAQTLRRLAKHQHRLKSVALLHPGTITVVQRFRADAGLFVHIHLLATDGVFESIDGADPVFRPVAVLEHSSPEPAPAVQLNLFDPTGLRPCLPPSARGDGSAPGRPRRVPWTSLLARILAIDITSCPSCGGRLRITSIVTDADEIAGLLHGARAPPPPPPPGQLPLALCV